MRSEHPVLTLLILLLALWISLPEHRRRAILMRLAATSKEHVHRIAQATGRYGISRELSRDTPASSAAYGAAYDLMTGPYQRLSAWYDSLRQA